MMQLALIADLPPTDAEILAVLAHHAPDVVPLRHLCAALWPGISWQSAKTETRSWPGGLASTPAEWLRIRLRDLHRAGRVALGDYDRAMDPVLGFTYQLPRVAGRGAR